MDRLNQLREEAGSSRDVSLNSSSAASEAYLTANESSSKYYSLADVDSTLESPIKDPIKDVSLASAAADTTDGTITTPNQLISDLSPIGKKNDLLDSFKIGKHIEASNILSGGVDIFDDNDNSYDGNELVIDDVCMDLEDKSSSELKIGDNLSEEFPKESTSVDTETEIPSKDTEVVLHIDGKNVDAIDIGNGLYLYRKGDAQEELAAVQIIDADQPQPTFKFLKVRENAEGNLEVYEEIEVEVPKEVPSKAPKSTKTNVSHVPIKDINKVITEPMSHKAERKVVSPPKNSMPQMSTPSDVKNTVDEGTTLLTEHKNEVNFNGKPVKINEAKKSPVIGSFTPMTFHSTPNKEGIPLTKTMVNQQLHPNRHSDNVKKTIEVLTDCTKQKLTELPNKDENISLDDIKASSSNVVDIAKPENVFEDLPSSLATEKEVIKCLGMVKSSTNENSIKNKTEITSPKNENLLNPNEVTTTPTQENLPIMNKNDFPTMPEETIKQTHEAKSLHKDQNKPESIVREPLEQNDISKEPSKEVLQTPKNVNEISDAIKAPIKVTQELPSKVDNLPEDMGSSTNFVVDSLKADHTLAKTDEPKVAEVSPKDCSESIDMVESAKTDNTASKMSSNVGALSKVIGTVPIMEKSLNDIVSQSDQSETPKNVDIKSAKDLSLPIDTPLKLQESLIPTGLTPEIKTQPKNENNPDKASDVTKNNEVQLPVKQVVSVTSNILISKNPQQISDKSIPEVKPKPILNMSTKSNETVICGDVKTQSIQTGTMETGSKVSISETLSNNETYKGDDKNNISDDLIQLTDLGIETTKDKSVELQNKVFTDSLASDKIIQPVPIVNKTPEVMKEEPLKATDVKQFNTRTSVAMPFTVKSSGDGINKYVAGIPLLKSKINEDNNFITKQINKAVIIKSSASSSHDNAIMNKPGASTLAKGSIQITSNLCIKKQDVPEMKVTPLGAQIDTKTKSINNNNAVPFGKWTEANKQAYLSRIKETKVFNPNANQIKQCNDLNRRDVLKKIDSQRISNSIASRTHEILNKVNIKHESGAFVNKNTVKHDYAVVKAETVNIKPETIKPSPKPSGSLPSQNLQTTKISGIPHSQTLPTNPMISKSSSSSTITKIELVKNEIPAQKRTEINNQDLIDKTIEDILNDKTTKMPRASEIEVVPNTAKVEQKEVTPKDKQKTPTKPKFDEIELKMNELHGIPFIERPPHELPNKYKTTKTSTNSKRTSPKADKVTKPVPPKQQPKSMEVDEEEILEHEPVTGDMDFTKNIRQLAPQKSTTVSQKTVGVKEKPLDSNKDAVITEKDFDKFARRTSVTYDNSITVNYDDKKPRNIIKSMVERDVIISRHPNVPAKAPGIGNPSYKPQQMLRTYGSQSKPSNALPIRVEEGYNKNSQSKFQIAYQSALTAKRQKEFPISVIEDKPVKVVFMDHNTEYATTNLNVQGKELSPAKKLKEPETFAPSSCDSLDSDMVGIADEAKLQEYSKKPKHQRKQVLTPVEMPEMEILDPVEFTDESSPKKKRKMEDISKSIDINKSPKSILPKKTYLLGRTALCSEPQNAPICAPIETPVPPPISNAASAIDNLVKAAELLETQSQNMSIHISSSQNSPQTPTPVKRGRGRPRKTPLPEGVDDKNEPATPVSSQKKPRLVKTTQKLVSSSEEDSSDDGMVMENWTMGKINEKIVCPICNKLFRSENVVFKHVKHCTGPSPNRSDSDKRSSRRGRSMESDNSSQDTKTSDTESSKGEEKLKKRDEPNTKQGTSDEGHRPESIVSEVIVIEDTPLKTRSEKRDMATQPIKRNELRKSAITKAKVQQRSNNLVCEFCGKAFRQLSYLVSHKLQHKNEEPKKPQVQSTAGSVFSCEVCKKEFRKLHHLVQHRIIHNPTDLSFRRKSSAEQSETKTKPAPEMNKAVDDGSAGFRCEPCDKSFRKLHHLVEHRETHDGINRQKSTPATQISTEKVADKPPSSPPKCEICKKSFRKLHHLIEHKEQHIEVGSEKSDDKSVKSALSTKDIIHECSLCYMVFPNEHSLNKHSVNCQRKKRQSVSKLPKHDEQAKQEQDLTNVDKAIRNVSKIGSENIPQVSEIKVSETLIEEKTIAIKDTNSFKSEEPKVTDTNDNRLSSDETKTMTIEAKPKTTEIKTIKENKSTPKRKDDDHKTTETQPLPPKVDTTQIKKAISDIAEKPKIKKPEIIETIVIEDTPKKKVGPKDKLAATVTKRQKSTNAPSQADNKLSSDDDEVRYMLNPNFKPEETSESKVFMKVRAQKRNSLQLERPNSKELIKRRTSLQNPPKIPRLKPKTESKLAPVNELRKTKTDEPVPSTDSDDSEVKYAFPEQVMEKEFKPIAKPDTVSKVEKKLPRKSLADKRKSLGGIAKRKSMGKAIVSKAASAKTPAKNVVKRRSQQAEHRCDCGQLFSSAALLSRHTTLTHTPPRIRRRRSPPPEDNIKITHTKTSEPTKDKPARKSSVPQTVNKVTRKSSDGNKSAVNARKSSVKSDAGDARISRKSSVRSDIDKAIGSRVSTDSTPSKRSKLKASTATKPKTGIKVRKSAAHRGVPVPEKMRKVVLEGLNK